MDHERLKERAGISDDTIAELAKACREAPAGSFVDLGTGEGISLETILEAAPAGRTVWTVDDSSWFLQEVRGRLGAVCGLWDVRFLHAPLEKWALSESRWYRSATLAEIVGPVALLCVDGPIGQIGRYPALPFFLTRLTPVGGIVLLDDCRRPAEQEIFSAWLRFLDEQRFPHRAELIPTDRGLGKIVLGDRPR